MNRRSFVVSSAAAMLTASLLRATGSERAPHLLLRGSWQSLNIGDIGHTPGALTLLAAHFPEAKLTLWPGEIGRGARELLLRSFPNLEIAEGHVGPEGRPTTPELQKAWDEADVYISGSGSGFPASEHARAFREATGKPIGVFGVSWDPVSGFGLGRDPEGGTLAKIRERALALAPDHLAPRLRWIVDQTSFFFCRDTISRDYLKAQGVKTPVLEFGPDTQLGMRLRDDEKGLAYLESKGLREREFICVIPRLRYTPYYRLKPGATRAPSDDIVDAINARTTESDHARLREMMISYVRHTGNKVLACPEMTYQIELAKSALVDPLPDDVKKNVVWRDTYWMPDEAASIYARALAVVSLECHSPLIALRQGTPAFHVRQPTDTCKGQMYRDFGANDWLFEVEQASGAELWSRLKTVHHDFGKAQQHAKAIMARVDDLQTQMVAAARATARP